MNLSTIGGAAAGHILQTRVARILRTIDPISVEEARFAVYEAAAAESAFVRTEGAISVSGRRVVYDGWVFEWTAYIPYFEITDEFPEILAHDWFAVQNADLPAMGTFRRQWYVYGSPDADKDGEPSSCLFGYQAGPASEENVRLASAAPDLYRALAAILADCEGDVTGEPWDAARAALAKARGET